MDRSSQEILAAFFLPVSLSYALLSQSKICLPLPGNNHDETLLKRIIRERFQKEEEPDRAGAFFPSISRLLQWGRPLNLKPNSGILFHRPTKTRRLRAAHPEQPPR